jgi:uncharacterized protein YbjT (DUF2867 family)
MAAQGHTGPLGGRLIPNVVMDGYQVFALTRSPASHARLEAMRVTPFDADLESALPLALPAIDAFVHAAAFSASQGQSHVGGP